MKKTIILLMSAMIISVVPSAVTAQEKGSSNDFRFTLKTNPLSALGGPFWVVIVPLTGEYKALFEAKVSEKSSVQIGAGYVGPSVLLNLDEFTSEESAINKITTNGFRVQGLYKFFISRDLSAPEGFYIGPHLSYASVDIKNKDDESDSLKGTKFNANGVLGYQLITSGGFTLDIFTGIGFVSRKWELTGEDFEQDEFKDKAGVNIPLGFSFGYAF